MASKQVSPAKQAAALAIVAEWMQTRGYGTYTACGTCAGCTADVARAANDPLLYCVDPRIGPAPTGNEAAGRGLGPVLDPTWDWPASGPTPTIILEGGPYDWTFLVSEQRHDAFRKLGILADPYSGYALCLYAV